MRRGPASGHIRAARANLQLATQICGRADLARLQRALNLLETTASEMRLAEAAVRSGISNERGELRREAELMKREVACLVRVVDGCAALYRGRSIRLGCTALTYTPQGRAATAPLSVAAFEMQA